MVVLERDNKSAIPFVAADLAGAGVGEEVLVVSGSTARFAAKNGAAPVDAAIVGIIDTVETDREAKK